MPFPTALPAPDVATANPVPASTATIVGVTNVANTATTTDFAVTAAAFTVISAATATAAGWLVCIAV